MKSITIPKNLERKFENIAERTGLSQEDLFINAILYYFESLRNKMDFKKELKAWEAISDNDLIRFEKNLF